MKTHTIYVVAGILALAAVTSTSPGAQQSPPAGPALDFEYFKTNVQPIFVAKRPGHARCISCHGSGTPLRLQPLASGATSWTDEESQKNFAVIKRVAGAGAKSRLIMHPLEESAGGDFYHSGGKHWASQNDPEWKVLQAFVLGQK